MANRYLTNRGISTHIWLDHHMKWGGIKWSNLMAKNYGDFLRFFLKTGALFGFLTIMTPVQPPVHSGKIILTWFYCLGPEKNDSSSLSPCYGGNGAGPKISSKLLEALSPRASYFVLNRLVCFLPLSVTITTRIRGAFWRSIPNNRSI